MTPDEMRRAVEVLPDSATLLLSVGELRAALTAAAPPADVSAKPNDDRPREEWLTTEQVAAKLNVTPRWVYGRREQLGGVRVSHRCIRFSPRAVERFLQRHRTQPYQASLKTLHSQRQP